MSHLACEHMLLSGKVFDLALIPQYQQTASFVSLEFNLPHYGESCPMETLCEVYSAFVMETILRGVPDKFINLNPIPLEKSKIIIIL